MKHSQLKSFVSLSLITFSRAFPSFLAKNAFQKMAIGGGNTRAIHLSPTGKLGMEPSGKSVTGVVYNVEAEDKGNFPIVQLYTKEGCTLCDKVSDILKSIRDEHPHSLEAVDITDPDKSEIYDKYKWDIPVLHIDGKYWTKHKLDSMEAIDALTKAALGNFEEGNDEPDAAAMERRMAERKAEK